MEKLRELRKEAHLTTTALGEILGCSNQAITNYELGNRTPDLKTLIMIADYFDVSVDYLIGRTEAKAIELNQVNNDELNDCEKRLVKMFREIGITHGEKGQKALMDLVDNLLKIM